MRTQQEITEAIERLKVNKQKCNQFTLFGDDVHPNIDGMITLLEHQMFDESDIEDHFQDDSVRSYVIDFYYGWYVEGDNIENFLYPEN